MTDVIQPAAPAPQAPPAIPDSDRELPMVIYILFLIPAGITHIVGLILAYVKREGASEALRSHYTLLIRSFWIGLLYFAVSGLLCLILIGFPMLCAVTVWFYVRMILGLMRLTRGEAYPNPETWLV